MYCVWVYPQGVTGKCVAFVYASFSIFVDLYSGASYIRKYYWFNGKHPICIFSSSVEEIYLNVSVPFMFKFLTIRMTYFLSKFPWCVCVCVYVCFKDFTFLLKIYRKFNWF